MIINVTIKNITDGCRDNCRRCPINLAVMDALQTNEYATNCWTDCDAVSIDGEVFHLEEMVQEKIACFDRGERIEPFSFELECDHLFRGSVP